jgi:hypothetical protein
VPSLMASAASWSQTVSRTVIQLASKMTARAIAQPHQAAIQGRRTRRSPFVTITSLRLLTDGHPGHRRCPDVGSAATGPAGLQDGPRGTPAMSAAGQASRGDRPADSCGLWLLFLLRLGQAYHEFPVALTAVTWKIAGFSISRKVAP